ncbi:dTDP-glucose 4,6-dehydratase [Candidatus Magnetoovum chiemensis]|nr:dTDP-glucose 4,6-dehydratase [Candidatus Magnetoovum chiemensis]
MRILITGGCGFIGSNFIHYIVNKYHKYKIINLDALTYAGNLSSVQDINTSKYAFFHDNIENVQTVDKLVKDADAVINFAAETHVDRSIEDAYPFLRTNILGLQALLDCSKKAAVPRFIHISTDEVYGSLETKEGKFHETTPLNPNSPYSASKAAADLLIRSYVNTYDMPAIIVRPSNNYGPYQYPEKLIPLMITNLMEDRKVPVYGQGRNIRDWLYVKDTCSAIDTILHNGTNGETYNVGGECELENIELVKMTLKLMDKDSASIEFVKDRLGHDYRYALDNSKITAQLGWKPQMQIQQGIAHTIKWYQENQWWWKPLVSLTNAS